MAWLNREKAPLSRGGAERTDTPDGLWERCAKCAEIILRKDFAANQNVCPKCDCHFYLPAEDRVRFLLDPDTFVEYDRLLASKDPLEFSDRKTYRSRLDTTAAACGRPDAIICGAGKLMDIPVHLGVFDFKFLGGSMGTVVGEKIKRLYLRAAETKHPAIIVSSSGGARMQEGILSLMQMAKTCAALSLLKQEGVPYISVLTHPTTGGVAASFATLGDINLAEPNALIGFAGPRVIQQTIREKLPEGFQRSEYLLDHGMLDMICHRDSLRGTIGRLLEILTKGRRSRPA